MTAAPGRSLRYLVIGSAGAVAEKHTRALSRLPCEIAALCDVDELRGRERARALGCSFGRDYRALLGDTRPDVAVICTPPPSHAAIVRDCLLRGVHVLVEKPMAIEVREADELVAVSDRSGVVLAVNFGERFSPSVEHARGVIARGELGRVLRVLSVQGWRRDPEYYRGSDWRGTWRGEGGGVLMNQAPHTLDLICHLLGVPSKVWGVTRTLTQAIECEDTAQALLEYPTGALGYVSVSTAHRATERRLEIAGDRAVLVWDGDSLTVRAVEPSVADASPPPSPEPCHASVHALEAHESVHIDLRRAILEGTRPRCDARDGLMSLELANAIILSSATERPVGLPVDRDAYSELLRQRRGG
jgi:UDP-N-acetyl-2-amino-2-deoxyglucuronate dehydrogenase